MNTVLTDIEGTTSSISFVRDVLFPYARRALPGFVAARGRDPEVRQWLDQAAGELPGVADDEALVRALQAWMDADRKHTALKALQGMLWKDGYQRDEFRAHLYPDAAPALEAWHRAGHGLAVYSSGSVPAQKLFFGHSEAGDLTPLFSAWFDTRVGGKREAGSYGRIAAALGRPAQNVVFLSDVVEELDAAREAGLRTVLVDRPQDYPRPRLGELSHGHRRILGFAELDPEQP